MNAKDLRNQAAYFRQRAREMRLAAGSGLNPECHAILIDLASAYDEKAAFLLSRLGPRLKIQRVA